MHENTQQLSHNQLTEPDRGVLQSRGNAGGAHTESEKESGLLDYLRSTTAASYYLSLLFHLVIYGAAAGIFVYLGYHLIETDQTVTPLRASLDEFDRDAEQPAFEIAAEISISEAESDSSIQQISNNLKAVENGLIETLSNDVLPSFEGNKDESDSGSDGFLFKIPESGLAVTKGSFTVWTEPERPDPGQRYFIIIEIRLPDNVKGYRVNDLRGMVIGSDDYRQRIPYDSKAPDSSFYTDETKVPKKITGSESIKVRNNKVQLAIRVPGALRLVRDTIQVRSRRLREKQELELVFGKP